MTHWARRYFIAGVLFWIPVWLTLLVIHFIVDILDRSIDLLPTAYQPETLLGFDLPGFGVILSLAVVFFTGVLITNFFGKKLLHWGEKIVDKIPLVRSIYTATKQVLETLLSSSGQSFRKVYLVEYPRKGSWSVAFQTGNTADEIENFISRKTLTLFVPTTPNPTSGYLIMVPKEDAHELNITVEQALKLVISLGVVQPQNSKSLQSTQLTES